MHVKSYAAGMSWRWAQRVEAGPLLRSTSSCRTDASKSLNAAPASMSAATSGEVLRGGTTGTASTTNVMSRSEYRVSNGSGAVAASAAAGSDEGPAPLDGAFAAAVTRPIPSAGIV